MQDDNIPTWEMPPGLNPEKDVSEADVERAEAFEEAMSDMELTDNNSENNEDNEGIVAASSIVNYGANAACAKIGVQGVADKIADFDPSSYEDPIGAFYSELGIENREDLEATKNRENENLDPTVSTQKISREHFVQAISDFKELLLETKSDPRFSELNDAASSYGTTVFDMASKKAAEEGGKPDFVGALIVLKAQRKIMEEAEKNGIDEKTAAEFALGEDSTDEPDKDPGEPFYSPESDKAIQIQELLKKKTKEARELFSSYKNIIPESKQKEFDEIVKNAEDATDNIMVKIEEKKEILEKLDSIIDEIEYYKHDTDPKEGNTEKNTDIEVKPAQTNF